MTPLRVGLLGCGGFARKHAATVQSLPAEVQLVACADRNAWKAQAIAEEFTGGAARTFTTTRELIESGLDVLLVCLPPYAHADEVALCAQHGIHLLIEKPIALTSAQAWQMVRDAERAGIRTQVGFMSRFGAAVETFKALQDAGKTGAVGLFDAQYYCHALHAPWWRDRERSGGQLLEQVIHHLDLLRYLLGDPARVYARMANLFHRDVPGYTIEDLSVTVASYDTGALGVLRASNAAVPGRWDKAFSVIAAHATLHAQDHQHATLHWTDPHWMGGSDDGPPRPPEMIDAPDEAHRKQLLDLIHAVRTGGRTRTPLREGALSLDLALAAVQSATESREVIL